MGEIKLEEYREFVGIYDESVPLELCKIFVENWETAKKNLTIIDLNVDNETKIIDGVGVSERGNVLIRKDTAALVAPLMSTIYPVPPVQEYFKLLQECFYKYIERYAIRFHGGIFNDVFKIHKVKKGEGYHAWHYENDSYHFHIRNRLLAYMTYLEVPEKGGETEFLHQSLRIAPQVGRTLIWPAGFTHMHRGNPPLDGEKMYITGWFAGGVPHSEAINKV